MLHQADVPHPWQVNPYPDWFPDLEVRGPFRRPRLDGTFVYFDRAGKVEWISPLVRAESTPTEGREWWWSATLGESISLLAKLAASDDKIAHSLNVEQKAVDYFLRSTTAPRLLGQEGAADEELRVRAAAKLSRSSSRQRGCEQLALQALRATPLELAHQARTREFAERLRRARLLVLADLATSIPDEAPGVGS
jgi:hypothetical protein